MNKANGALAFFLVASLGLACNDSGLKSQNTGTGGQSRATASGGSLGVGGAGTGGAIIGGAGGGSGGSEAGGALGAGGIPSSGGRAGSNAGGSASGGRGGSNAGGSASGGRGGSNAGGSASGGAGGADAGAGKDSAVDTACIPPPCPLLKCAPGYQAIAPPCGCPTCVPIDGGASDAIVCPPVACPAIGCANGTLPNPDPCGCPICAPADAAIDRAQTACKSLDECACRNTDGCAPIAEACYCPFPQCGSTGACICGGGKYLGCAPVGLTTACSAAKAQVATLCPTLKGPTFDGLCARPDSACVTECLGKVTSCNDVFCTFCEACDCATDRFSQCLASCTSPMAKG